ncbi:hypothetical protein UCREL1_3597 [Eutypa lata UCREL1]|uniref:DUF6546 domain-containing protein n=1 Tax=Eutypa lata (strain UCR-EL1) TaxID=1287681 RepID=M7SXU4_EUTLA|nr:hypothetical protein UCREL1_3597 [Eutypa lata UCREL1]
MTKDGIDVLSCTLREVSHGLTTLKIRGPIGPQFFWPLKDSKADTPYWPNLRSLGGFLYVYLPGGTWLFKHAALDGTSCEVCAWRPNTEALNELYLAVAKAVSRMPRLEIMALRTTNRPMFHDFRFKVIGRRAYLRWHSTPKFEPSDQVLHLWEKVVESRDLELDVASYRADEADIGGDEFGIEFIGEHELDDGLWNSHEEEAEDDVSDGHDDADFGASNSDGDSESSGDDDADSSDGGDAETGDDEN